MIEVKNITKSFEGRPVLKNISTVFEDGKTNLIIGRSGSGKTVMIKNIIGLMRPDSGQILYDGRDLTLMNKEDLKILRKEMGMLFQARKKGTCIYYTMYDSLGGHEIRVEPAEESMGWVSLGKYYLEKGEAKVVLDDRGGGSEEVDEKSEGGMRMMQNKQMIVADAVKWVRRGR